MADIFSLGYVTATPEALLLIRRDRVDLIALLDRHAGGDFGDVDGLGALANRETLDSGVGTVLSAYNVREDETLYVATTIPEGGDQIYTDIMVAKDW